MGRGMNHRGTGARSREAGFRLTEVDPGRPLIIQRTSLDSGVSVVHLPHPHLLENVMVRSILTTIPLLSGISWRLRLGLNSIVSGWDSTDCATSTPLERGVVLKCRGEEHHDSGREGTRHRSGSWAPSLERSRNRGGLGALREDRPTIDPPSVVAGVHRSPSPPDSPIRNHPLPGTNQPARPAALIKLSDKGVRGGNNRLQ
jgi:hypothetical protein